MQNIFSETGCGNEVNLIFFYLTRRKDVLNLVNIIYVNSVLITLFNLMAFLFITSSVFCQNPEAIEGAVVDAKTNLPVPFATIKIMEGRMIFGGVVSNGSGDFQIPLKYQSVIDSVVVSCIGYSNRVVTVRELTNKRLNIIKLNPNLTQLHEVVVTAHHRPLGAVRIVRTAIENIPRNYPTRPYSYTGYYRDYQLEEQQYVNLNEAIIELFDRGFQTIDFDSTKIKLYQYRSNSDFPVDHLASMNYDNAFHSKFIPTAKVVPFGGNEFSQLRIHDPVRNHEAVTFSWVNEFRRNFVSNHVFRRLENVYLNTTSLYHIAFETKSNVSGPEHIGRGEIYIEEENFAIHKMSYSVYHKELRDTKLLYHVELEYARSGKYMYLNYISLDNSFVVTTDKGFSVLEVIFDRGDNAFVIVFNHFVEKRTALNSGNYHFSYEGTDFRIDRIELRKNLNEVHVFMDRRQDLHVLENVLPIVSRIRIQYGEIRDQSGLLLNEVIYKPAHQFREFFLQRINQEEELHPAGPFIAKDKSLKKAAYDSLQLSSIRSWMNTPLKSK
jgi:hypothetical protein